MEYPNNFLSDTSKENQAMSTRDNAFLFELKEIATQDTYLIDEYNREVKVLEKEMSDLTEFAREHSYLLKEQGHDIHVIEKTMTSVDTNVLHGVKTLQETERKYDKIEMLKGKLALISICCIAGAAIGGPIGIGLGAGHIVAGLVGGIGLGTTFGGLGGYFLSK